jgi:hypothetical protein
MTGSFCTKLTDFVSYLTQQIRPTEARPQESANPRP